MSEHALEQIMETLAEIEHNRWAGQALTALDEMTDERRARWRKLANTPYPDLDEKNKELDRMQVREYLPIIMDYYAVERDKYQTYWAATIQRAEKAEAERDEWKIECEKSRETIWTVTAQRDEAIGDRDQARDERDEARVVVEYIMCKWLSVVTERDAARAEAERLREALEKIINFNGVCFVTIEHKIERDTIKDIARAALEDAKEPK